MLKVTDSPPPSLSTAKQANYQIRSVPPESSLAKPLQDPTTNAEMTPIPLELFQKPNSKNLTFNQISRVNSGVQTTNSNLQ